MNKYLFSALAIVLSIGFIQAQKPNFSGTWNNPELEIISGIQYSNAMPAKIVIVQTKDSIKLERTSVESDGNVTNTETITLNGKQSIRISKSKRTIRTSATWNDRGTILTFFTTYSYADKPEEIEYKNTEKWELSPEGTLIIEKFSDASVTDDWTIKAIFKKV